MDLERTDVDDATADQDDQEIADELLIEEISIDGMCGVY
jgi:mycofactocin precursor